MSEKIHVLETEVVEQVLKEQPDFTDVLNDLAGRYGLPARHVLLISNYLQKDLPPGVPAGADKLLSLCDHVRKGYFRIDMVDGDLVLFREQEDIPEALSETESAPEPETPLTSTEEPSASDSAPSPPPHETSAEQATTRKSPECPPLPEFGTTTEPPRSSGPSLLFTISSLCALIAVGYFLYRTFG